MKTEGKKKAAGRSNCIKAFLMSGALAVTSCLSIPQAAQTVEAAADTELRDPRVEVNTCETVYFGNYWQEDTNGDGKADQKDEKRPIRWRILSKSGNDAYVIADKILDAKEYNDGTTDITWEDCTLRKWLNGEFLNSAFTAEEQAVIAEQTLVNANNEEYGTDGGNDTIDKVYLPSIADMKNTEYGFSKNPEYYDQTRTGKGTAYAKEQGLMIEGDMPTWWWLRQPGHDATNAVYVDDCGSVFTRGHFVNRNTVGVTTNA